MSATEEEEQQHVHEWGTRAAAEREMDVEGELEAKQRKLEQEAV